MMTLATWSSIGVPMKMRSFQQTGINVIHARARCGLRSLSMTVGTM